MKEKYNIQNICSPIKNKNGELVNKINDNNIIILFNYIEGKDLSFYSENEQEK